MPNESAAAALGSRYVEHAVSDLEENRRLQQELIHRIEKLKQEETLLLDILTLARRFDAPADDTASTSPQAPQPSVPVPVPQQAQAEPTPDAAPEPEPEPEREPEPAPERAAVKRARRTPRQAAPKATARPPQPLLGDIFTELLRAHNEPRLAKELREELLEKHPDRTPTPQVVRNTLESLVAKGRVQRHKQQRSVMYTVAEPDGRQPAPAAADTATA